jgi:peptidoglycan-associated lipoprotein
MRRAVRMAAIMVLTGGLVPVLFSCSHRKPVVAPPLPATAPPSEAMPTPPPTSSTTQVTSEPTMPPPMAPATTPESAVSESALPADLAEVNRAGYIKDAFFDTGKAELRPDARDALATDAEWLKAHPSVKVTIEGHCDERNTEAYNLALGWRRANATMGYLVTLGVPAASITTISYGEERPFATCHNESCWSQNRRAHFVITAK